MAGDGKLIDHNSEQREDIDKTPAESKQAPRHGTVAGATAAGAIGLAAGIAIGGPVGGVLGAAAGAALGGTAGHFVADMINPDAEDAYWRMKFSDRPYVRDERGYEEYRPAYRYGWESRARHADKDWEKVESELGRDWDAFRGDSRLDWDDARPATRDAWERASRERDSGE